LIVGEIHLDAKSVRNSLTQNKGIPKALQDGVYSTAFFEQNLRLLASLLGLWENTVNVEWRFIYRVSFIADI